MSAIATVELYRRKSTVARLDIVPFGVCHLALHVQAWRLVGVRGAKQEVVWLMIAIPCVLVLHLLTFLSTRWSVRWKCAVAYERCPSWEVADWALVTPPRNGGKAGLVALHRDSAKGQSGAWFSFQKRTFVRDPASRSGWSPLTSPFEGVAVNEYVAERRRGVESERELAAARLKWGANEFEIPDPTFLELFEEHYLAPFFVFQVACCVLWSLDEYWLYSAFTLLMLLVFEATLCAQRFRSLEHLRGVRKPPRLLFVFRDQQWRTCSSDDLVPGDVASFSVSSPGVGRRRLLRAPVFFAPCDAVVLKGSCVVNEAMLTGESVPQRKDALVLDGDNGPGEKLDLDGAHRRHVVFGGTEVLDATVNPPNLSGSSADAKTARHPLSMAPPDRGVVVHVVRTGFETSQGQLMRMILYATERVVGSTDSAAFIGVLLLFALAAAGYVLREGLKDDPPRNRFKLCLHCVLIITSVVPPELPMELSLAVTNSLAALSKASVFCTEPFRVAFAGAVDVCCFDKTGTLTRDELTLRGVHARDVETGEGRFFETASPPTGDLEARLNDPNAALVLGCCHSLAVLEDGTIIGETLERAQFDGMRDSWRLVATDVLQHRASSRQPWSSAATTKAAAALLPVGHHHNNNNNNFNATPTRIVATTLRIVKRYAFVSELRRMSCVVVVDEQPRKRAWLVCKGAPEVIKTRLANVPADYDASWRARAILGERVLALASRSVRDDEDYRRLARADAERRLDFRGFVAFSSPLKPGTRAVIKELMASTHRCIVITGDGALTAAHVARQVGILTANLADVLVRTPDNRACWRSLISESDDGEGEDPFRARDVAERARFRDLVVRGDGLSALDARDATFACRHALVFARVAPNQKEQVVAVLNAAGHTTLMCGDGTNDVGALKRAHVGVSIMNSPALEARLERAEQQAASSSRHHPRLADFEMDAMDLDPTLVNLGDASIASPFTSKRTTIDCVLSIVCQGRCTLVTMIQVFKILALMCLLSAGMLSVLYLNGVKQGDSQMTVAGLSTAVFFFLLSRAQPLRKLSSRRPPQRVFDARPAASIVVQFVIHLAALFATMRLCEPYSPKADPRHVPDGAFVPSVINTSVFLLTAVLQLNTFGTNYQGHPFMQSLAEHKALSGLLFVCYALLAVAASGVVPVLSRWLQLVDAPTPGFRLQLFGILLADTAASWLVAFVL